MRIIHNFILFFTAGLMFSGCISYNKLLYLQGDNDEYTMPLYEPYKVQPGDILTVDVKNLEDKSINFITDQGGGQRFQTQMLLLTGYEVNDSGFIKLPLINEQKVSGLSIEEIEDTLTARISKYIRFVKVKVKLVNFKYTILGEAPAKGVHYMYDSRPTLLMAISQAGGFADISDKRKVKLIRQLDDRHVKTYMLDFSDTEVLESQHFRLWPDDILFVYPLKAKALQVNAGTISLIFSTISFTLTLAFAVNNFLNRK